MTDAEKYFFECITSGDENLGVLDSEVFGIKVKVVCLVQETLNDRLMQPIGIIVNDELFKALQPPEEDKTLGKVVIMKKKKEQTHKPGHA